MWKKEVMVYFMVKHLAISVEDLRERNKRFKVLCSVRDSNRIPPDHKVRRLVSYRTVHSLSLDTKQTERINRVD